MESKIKPVPALKRKRGGQPGNRNRLRHGFYSRAAIAARAPRKARIEQILRRTDALVAMAALEAQFRRRFAAWLRVEAQAFVRSLNEEGRPRMPVSFPGSHRAWARDAAPFAGAEGPPDLRLFPAHPAGDLPGLDLHPQHPRAVGNVEIAALAAHPDRPSHHWKELLSIFSIGLAAPISASSAGSRRSMEGGGAGPRPGPRPGGGAAGAAGAGAGCAPAEPRPNPRAVPLASSARRDSRVIPISPNSCFCRSMERPPMRGEGSAFRNAA